MTVVTQEKVMTEADWLASVDPVQMLEEVKRNGVRRTGQEPSGVSCWASDRKLRLFAVACARQVWHLLSDERCRRAVEVAERFANGLATERERKVAVLLARDGANAANQGYWNPPWLPFYALGEDTTECVRDVLATFRNGDYLSLTDQAALLRCVIDNPFRPVKWGTAKHFPWLHDSTVLSLARAAYEDRPGRKCERCHGLRWEPDNLGRIVEGVKCTRCHGSGRIEDGTLDPFRLALLADAMEEAGCADEELLRHLRGEERCWKRTQTLAGRGPARYHHFAAGPESHWTKCCDDGWHRLRGPHVRGCHAVDSILGKN